MAEQGSSPQHMKPQSRRMKVPIIIGLIALVLIAGGWGISLWLTPAPQVEPEPAAQALKPVEREDEPETTPEEPIRVDGPIDFAALQATNPEIYAWINIPGTNVDYPICQSLADHTFYLNHDAQGNYADAGALYSESNNSTTFNDSVTLIYGHSGYGDAMFGTLHNFSNKEFFDNNEFFTIYTPGHILTYRVVSAYMYDDRHIMNSFDFAKEGVTESYFATVTNPDSLLKNTREGIVLAPSDKIVQLSTCMNEPELAANRFLVTGVLISDQLTN